MQQLDTLQCLFQGDFSFSFMLGAHKVRAYGSNDATDTKGNYFSADQLSYVFF